MMKQQKQQISPTRPKILTFYRSSDQVNFLIQTLKDQKLEFTVWQSQYSTVIESNNRKTRYVTQTYPDNVFKCSSMIKGNLGKAAATNQILNSHFSTINYNVAAGIPEGKYGKCINLDISGAYPQCLAIHKLIDNRTYSYLMDLDKKSRLPAIGMIAKKSIMYKYKNGELDSCEDINGKYTKVFQFIVQQINDLMNDCIKIAGSYYIMHWVDGIFLKKHTPVYIVDQINDLITEAGYKLKFEKITKFNLTRDGVFINIDMIKNGQRKPLRFADRNMVTLQNTITQILNGDLHELQGNTFRDLQLSDRISDTDLSEWFS